MTRWRELPTNPHVSVAGRVEFITAPRARMPVDFSAEDLFALTCCAHDLPAPVRKLRFAESMGRNFEGDYAWPAYRLIVEVQGGIWKRGGGAHSHPTKIVKDIERQQYAVLLGWFLMPVTTDEVRSGTAALLTRRVLESRGWRQGGTDGA